MSIQKLRDWLPSEFFRFDFTDSRAGSMLDVNVIEDNSFAVKKWPGIHKNVYNWCVLENGYAVGWNENPARGYSFPVIKIKP